MPLPVPHMHRGPALSSVTSKADSDCSPCTLPYECVSDYKQVIHTSGHNIKGTKRYGVNVSHPDLFPRHHQVQFVM